MKMEPQIRLINIESIIPNRFQPRLKFDDEALNDLANSIKEHGIIQPLVLRKVSDKFEIIAGERRFKAASIAGLTSVPAIIADLDDNESAEVAIIENTQRKALSPIEEAKSYQKLLDRKYITQEQLAVRLGTSQSNVANKIRLLTLDDSVQDALLKEKISERHARSLLRVTDKFKQVELLNQVINEKWPVRKLDEEINKILESYKKNYNSTGSINTSSNIDINVDDIVNNSVDILLDNQFDRANYQYNSRVKTDEKKKDSIFFNNLENESVNLEGSLSFGFNPFKNNLRTNEESERDYDLLELEEDEPIDKSGSPEEVVQEIQPVVVEEEYKTLEQVLLGFNKIVKNAKKNGVPIEVEDFIFEKYRQLIIRLYYEDEEKV